ncbi:hypothetical protein CH063_07084 [Colletotrichum higginsianum]|uniref:Uncharacterized protein n=1 Tax=Colletotrichum higginsianum (strain IMI 349063) TaxID=759273 RepID=H1V4V9_COLHI|nr:hypothetical protein CH063_07084 [Colletotrichum higginsianum]
MTISESAIRETRMFVPSLTANPPLRLLYLCSLADNSSKLSVDSKLKAAQSRGAIPHYLRRNPRRVGD